MGEWVVNVVWNRPLFFNPCAPHYLLLIIQVNRFIILPSFIPILFIVLLLFLPSLERSFYIPLFTFASFAFTFCCAYISFSALILFILHLGWAITHDPHFIPHLLLLPDTLRPLLVGPSPLFVDIYSHLVCCYLFIC